MSPGGLRGRAGHLRPAATTPVESLRPSKSWNADAPTTSVNPLSQRNCYRPRSRTSLDRAKQREEPERLLERLWALLLCLYSASQLNVTLCFVCALLAYTKKRGQRYQLSALPPQLAAALKPDARLQRDVPSSARPYSTRSRKSRVFRTLALKKVHIFVTHRCRASACHKLRGQSRAYRRRCACQRCARRRISPRR